MSALSSGFYLVTPMRNSIGRNKDADSRTRMTKFTCMSKTVIGL